MSHFLKSAFLGLAVSAGALLAPQTSQASDVIIRFGTRTPSYAVPVYGWYPGFTVDRPSVYWDHHTRNYHRHDYHRHDQHRHDQHRHDQHRYDRSDHHRR